MRDKAWEIKHKRCNMRDETWEMKHEKWNMKDETWEMKYERCIRESIQTTSFANLRNDKKRNWRFATFSKWSGEGGHRALIYRAGHFRKNAQQQEGTYLRNMTCMSLIITNSTVTTSAQKSLAIRDWFAECDLYDPNCHELNAHELSESAQKSSAMRELICGIRPLWV